MSLNEWVGRHKKCLLIVALIVFCLVSMGKVVLMVPRGELYTDAQGAEHVPGFFNDAVITYRQQIDGTADVTNWHSALFMYEGRALRCVLQAVTGTGWDGIATMRFMADVADVLLLANLAYWLALMLRKDWRFILLAIPLSMVPYELRSWLAVSLDYFHIVIWCSALSLSILLYKSPRRGVQVFCVVLLALLLLHMVQYRRNAALMLPVFVYLAVARFMPSCRIRSKALVGAVATLLLYVTAGHAVQLMGLPVKHLNYIQPMVESDLRVAAVLENRGGIEAQMRMAEHGMEPSDHEYLNSITAYWTDAPMTDRARALAYYRDQWMQNTRNMLMARFLQMSQFYYSGITPPVIERLADEMYPAMRQNPQRWKTLFGEDYVDPVRRVRRLVFTLLLVLLAAAGALRYLRHANQCTAEQKFLTAVLGSAALYCLSYVVVTPTADIRYMLPAHMLGCIAVGYILLQKLFSRLR